MTIISTFELLVKPQLPKSGAVGPIIPAGAAKLSRNVIQGYFLTLANLSNIDFECQLLFTSRLPAGRALAELIGVVDSTGSDIPFNLNPISTTQFEAVLVLPAQSTSLVILQPDFIEFENLLTDLNFEVRGYVELKRTAASLSLPPIQIIATPEQRGTFFADLAGATVSRVGLDQISYALPVQNGGVLTV
jgi:hypothetical protein